MFGFRNKKNNFLIHTLKGLRKSSQSPAKGINLEPKIFQNLEYKHNSENIHVLLIVTSCLSSKDKNNPSSRSWIIFEGKKKPFLNSK